MRAFTLVELLVSITLGLIIAFAAFAGFRVAAKTMVVSRNLARENRAIAEGYLQGMVEADFWYAEDDPFDATGQPQRVLYDAAQNPAPSTTVGDDGVYGQPFRELELPAHYWNYNISDDRTWSRQGHIKSTSHRGVTTGSYAQIGCIGHADPNSAWQHEVQVHLYSSLGWTGYLDYLPNAQPICYYLAAPDAGGIIRNSFGRPVLPFVGGMGMPAFPAKLWNNIASATIVGIGNIDAEKALARGAMHLYGITSAYAPREGWTVDGRTPAYKRSARGHITGADMPTYSESLDATLPHAALTARGWPDLVVKVRRTFDAEVSARLSVTVTIANPVTGKAQTMTYVPVSTTLRGARQQRQWPHWGSAVMDR